MARHRKQSEETPGVRIYSEVIGGNTYWRIYLGSKFTGGKAERHSRTTRKEADDFVTERIKTRSTFGTQGLSDFAPEALRDIQAALTLLGGEASLLKAAQFYQANFREDAVAKTLTELVDAFFEAKAKKSKDYLNGIRGTYHAFRDFRRSVQGLPSSSLGSLFAHEITTEDCEAWLAHQKKTPIPQRPAKDGKPQKDKFRSDNTLRHYCRDLSTLFSWAMSPKRRWVTANPWVVVDAPDYQKPDIGVLRPKAAEALLQAAADQKGRPLLAFVVFGLFGGIRRGEILRLTWDRVHLDEERPLVEVTAAASKEGQRRIVYFEEEAMRWLRLCPQTGFRGTLTHKDGRREKREDMVAPRDASNLLTALHRSAGLAEFPRNSLRHTAASQHSAKHQDAPKLADFLGHTNLRTAREHYREAILPSEAKAFQAIAPREN